MNHQVSEVLLHKASKNAYRTRFLLQSGAAKKRSSTPRLIQQIGGMGMLDFMAITLSERILKEPELEQVYGKMNLKTLIPLEKELLWFAFADHAKQDANAPILQKHCACGLMDRPTYFDAFLVEHLQVFYDCIDEEAVLLECANKFAAMRTFLDEAVLRRRMSGQKQRLSFTSTLNTIAEDSVTGEEDGDGNITMDDKPKRKGKRPSFLRRHSSKVASLLGSEPR